MIINNINNLEVIYQLYPSLIIFGKDDYQFILVSILRINLKVVNIG